MNNLNQAHSNLSNLSNPNLSNPNLSNLIYLNKPLNDKSTYVHFILDNGLKVFLIQDKLNADNAAISMRVNVGYEQDDIDYAGQAHLLEHMLFNGSENYTENEFKSYIKENCGHSNASTSATRTEYHYTIDPNALIKSLEMFGEFFSKPTLSDDCIQRELKAVNSEHEKNIVSDDRIKFMVMKEAMIPDNLYRKFGTGCLETLDKPEIGSKIREFYNKHYSADIMTLAIITPHQIDHLYDVVSNIFGQIPTKSEEGSKIKLSEPFMEYNKSFVGKIIPIKKEHSLTFYWPMEPYSDPIISPMNFLSHLIGNEANGTIHNILYQKQYIKSLGSSIGLSNTAQRLFTLSISLTDLGFENIQTICQTIYAYRNMLLANIENPNMEVLYNELVRQSAYRTDYCVQSSSLDRVQNLTESINEVSGIDISNILIYTKLQKTWNDIKPHFIDALNKMKPTNNLLIIRSFNYTIDDCPQKLKYYPGAQYDMLEINSEQIIELNGDDIFIQNLAQTMKLPPLNKYISTGTNLIDKSKQVLNRLNKYIKLDGQINDIDDIDNSLTKPEKVTNPAYDNITAFVLPTSEYDTPDVNIDVDIYFDIDKLSVESRIKSMLYFSIIKAILNDELYLLETSYSVSIDIASLMEYGIISIGIFGNYEKIDIVFETIIRLLKTNLYSISDQDKTRTAFDVQKLIILSNIKNQKYLSPYLQLGNIKRSIFNKFYISNDEIINCLENLIYEDVINFPNILDVDLTNSTNPINSINSTNPINSINSTKHVDIFIGGNFTEELQYKLLDIIKPLSNSIPDYNTKYHNQISLPINDIRKSFNPNETNNVVSVSMQISHMKSTSDTDIDRYYTDSCCLVILNSIINPHFFSTLRTSESYGYIVSADIKNNSTNLDRSKYYNFMVQSTKPVPEIIERIQKYIISNDALQNITKEQIENIIQSLINNLNSNDESLIGLINKIRSYYIMGSEIFDLKTRLISIYNKLKTSLNTDDLMAFYKNRIVDNNNKIIIGYESNNNQ
jgi:secreted Zn-dependent insulinase-like peptidase